MEPVSLFPAFLAGLGSFFSPCVLPLVPAYLSFVSGMSLDQLQGGEHQRALIRGVSANALFFVLGFSLIFILLGASATLVGHFLLSRMAVLTKVAGVLLVIFGLHIAGALRIPFLHYEKRLHLRTKPVGLIGSFLVGMAFAFGWSPCIGPFLAAILTYAATRETMGQGIALLGAYSIGLGIPFLVTAVAVNAFLSAFARIKRYFRIIEIVSGALLILVGLLIFTGRFAILSAWISG
ncbi:MAG: cytochrome c biogenesis protein CcdA [Candidatus Latescibacterota bacterium]